MGIGPPDPAVHLDEANGELKSHFSAKCFWAKVNAGAQPQAGLHKLDDTWGCYRAIVGSNWQDLDTFWEGFPQNQRPASNANRLQMIVLNDKISALPRNSLDEIKSL